VPEDYGPHKLSIPKAKGDAVNVPQAFKDYSDDIALLVPPIAAAADGKLVIVDSGAPAYKAMSGDATIDKTGKLVIANDAITAAKIAPDAVGPSEIATDAVGPAEIAAGAVGEAEVADGAVSSRKLKPTCGVVTAELVEAWGTANTWVDVAGAKLEITPAVASTLLVSTVLTMEATTTSVTGGETFELKSSLKVDAEAEQTRIGLYQQTGLVAPPLPYTIQVVQFYALALTAAVKHTIQLRGRKNAFGRRLSLPANTSGFSYTLFAS
jgi:hypothetical protein